MSAEERTAAGGKPRLVLVLQGGGALGAYHIGAYQALAERDVLPDWVLRYLDRRHQRGSHCRQ